MDLIDAGLEAPHLLLVRAFKEALACCGVTQAQRDAALRAAGVTHPLFWAQEAGQYALAKFARALAAETGDPQLGLRLAAAMPRGATGVLEYAVLSAASLRVTHALYARFGVLAGESVRYSFREQGGHTTVVFAPPAGFFLEPVVEDYRLVRLLLSGRRALMQPSYAPSAVCFTYPRPARLDTHRRIFGERVSFEFECELAGIRVPTTLLDAPLPSSEPVLHRILVHNVEQLMNSAPPVNGVVDRVKQILLASLHSGRPTIATVCKQLGISERTLRRRLSEENSSFAELLDEVRASLSSVLERAPDQTGKHIASKLGFESTTALRRAQKRWAVRAC
jgi:AraC-like DNA-binding protein